MQLFNCSNIMLYLKSKYSKYVIKKAISFMSKEQIELLVKDYESELKEFEPKDQRKLLSLIDKLMNQNS